MNLIDRTLHDFVPIWTKHFIFFSFIVFFFMIIIWHKNAVHTDDFLLCLNQIIKMEFIALIFSENVFVQPAI